MKILGEHLKATELSGPVRAAMAAASARFLVLPGFDLFTLGARSPYEWCVPKPRDEEQLINVYEEFVDRDLGLVKAPERIAKRVFGSFQVSKAYFGPSPRAAAYWYTPAVKLLATAQHFGCEVQRNGRTLTTNLFGYTMMVSPMACHSNLRRASVVTKLPAVDIGPGELVVPSLRTKHKLAVALMDAGADDACLWAANTVIRAEMAGLVDTTDLFAPSRAQVLSAAELRLRIDSIRNAALEASEVAQGHQAPISALYEAMVPTVCSAQRFKASFGDPWLHPDRSPRPDTRTSWVSRIEQLSTEALNALA